MKAVLESRRLASGLRRGEQFIICIDHATAHNQAAQILGPGWQLLPHPPHSPDCNKPIEHVHAQVDDKMKRWLKQRRAEVPRRKIAVQEAMDECTRVFKNIPQASITRDVASLPKTWQAIVDNHGGFVPNDLS